MESYNMATSNTSMNDKICLVTGATSGIGKATALGLAQRGATVIITGRNQAKGEEALSEIKARSNNDKVNLMLADFASLESTRQLAEQFKQKYQQLHVLINNAGLAAYKRQVTQDGFEKTFEVNYVAPFLLTNLLLDTIKASAPARIINVSSEAQAAGKIYFNDLQLEKNFNFGRAYSQSKLAEVLFTYELARKLQGTGVTVNCLHPGVVATNIWQHSPSFIRPVIKSLVNLFALTPEEGARTSLYLATSPDVADVTGKYFTKSVPKRSSEISYNEAAQQQLWDMSVQMVKLPVTVS